ncbi:hypothetical protein FB451DRAFT_1567183 [Mycena latifolia]|nr:hypothetical protein FB451DRAFT_1292840 [Mycena latifolia]KAJ7448773.1 hypothetical protein FB451DRAFT_1567183 [Mycena latifolia]
MKAFPSPSLLVLGVAAVASLILPARAVVQVGEATLLAPTASSNTCGVPISNTDLFAAVAITPEVNRRCGQEISVQFGDASVNLTIWATCAECRGSDIEITQAAYTALGAAVGPVAVTWEFE